MLTMAEKTFLGLAVTLSVVLIGIFVLPVFSFEVSLVTSPDRENFFLPAGEPFNITCRGSGADAEYFSSLKWLNKEGDVITEGNPGTRKEEKNALTLIFSDPKENDSGVYTCVADYKSRETLQKTVSIIFHGAKPTFKTDFETVAAQEKSSLDILCSAEGELPITYEWFNNENEEKITTDNTSSIYAFNRGNASLLRIPEVTSIHSGSYSCLARNQHGLSSKLFQLEVLSTGGNDTTNGTTTIRDAVAVNITTTSVKFAFSLTRPVNYIEVMYSEITPKNTAAMYNETFKYGSDYTIQGLVPARSYRFKFRTISSDDDQWSKPYMVVTLPEKPDVLFKSIDSGNVKFQWIIKYEDRKRQLIDRHEITYFSVWASGIDKWEPSGCGITIQVPVCSSSTYTISGLSSNSYYEIQVRAHTISGYSEPYTQKLNFY